MISVRRFPVLLALSALLCQFVVALLPMASMSPALGGFGTSSASERLCQIDLPVPAHPGKPPPGQHPPPCPICLALHLQSSLMPPDSGVLMAAVALIGQHIPAAASAPWQPAAPAHRQARAPPILV